MAETNVDVRLYSPHLTRKVMGMDGRGHDRFTIALGIIEDAAGADKYPGFVPGRKIVDSMLPPALPLTEAGVARAALSSQVEMPAATENATTAETTRHTTATSSDDPSATLIKDLQLPEALTELWTEQIQPQRPRKRWLGLLTGGRQ